MGNVTSDVDGEQPGSREYDQPQPSDTFTQAARFKTELGEMQRVLQTLHGSPPALLLPHQLALDGVVVSCDSGELGCIASIATTSLLSGYNVASGVRVLVGPVVGKVGFDSARVLLEVSARARITCHVSAINALTSEVAELPQCRCVLSAEAQQPAVFRIERLSPGREYRFCFSGIRREDAGTRRGSFRTPTLESGESEFRVIAVSGDDPADLQAGERSVWGSVRERVEHKTANCVLHLGGQVAMKRMFDYASLLLLQHGSSLSRDNDGAVDWRRMEARAVEVLRGAYRTQWSLSSDVQFVLANASNLMIWSDADVYPLFTTRKEFYINHDQPTLQVRIRLWCITDYSRRLTHRMLLQMQVLRTVTRCARRLYHEYQRQLWDDDMELVFEREVCFRLHKF